MDKEKVDARVNEFRQRCFREYNRSIGLPSPYTYPDGNPIQPVLPVHTEQNSIMIVGAYPSARFEMRRSTEGNTVRVIPVADNLHPFAIEEYFDGLSVRRLTSGDELALGYLGPLGRTASECWITDLVKVFLYKPEHRESCAAACPEFVVPVTRTDMLGYAKKSLGWLKDEVELAQPRLVITLGEEVARAITGDSRTSNEALLAAEIAYPGALRNIPTILAPHPEACRRMPDWKKRLNDQLAMARQFLGPKAMS
jgi:hypothetical protein